MVENRDFVIPLTFYAPLAGSPSEYCDPVWCGKTRMVALPDGDSRRNTFVGRACALPSAIVVIFIIITRVYQIHTEMQAIVTATAAIKRCTSV